MRSLKAALWTGMAVGVELWEIAYRWVGVGVAVLSLSGAIRSLCRVAPQVLLAGGSRDGLNGTTNTRRRRRARYLMYASATAALGLLVAPRITTSFPEVAAFFGGAAMLLVASLAGIASFLTGANSRSRTHTFVPSLSRLGIANVSRQPGRSLLTMGLIASATFLVTAIQAFYLDADAGGLSI